MELGNGCDLQAACQVTIDGNIAWRIFTKGIKMEEAKKGVTIQCNQDFGNRIFDMLAVMA